MLTPADYTARLLAAVEPLAPVRVPVGQVADWLGRVLAEDVRAEVAVPAFDNSAMDGYAVRADDLTNPPATLPVVGDIPAGDTRAHRLGVGEALRIMTGAALPAGADAVVQVEFTDGGAQQVRIDRAVGAGTAVRRAGSDLRPGDPVVPAGVRADARHTAAIVSCGVREVTVHPVPRVAVISTGDELRAPGEVLEPGQIVDSNGPMLAALVRQAGFEVARVQRIGDTAQDVRAALADLAGVDAIITSGGVSAGAFEPLKAAFGAGSEVTFSSVAMQPGKPQGFGVVDGRPLFALPGNPASSFVSFVLFAAPVLRRMAGRDSAIRTTMARAAETWRTSPGRMQVARVTVDRRHPGDLEVRPAGGASSHLTGGLAGADALALVPAETDQVAVGDRLGIIDLEGEFC
ncbi:molybdopterin molybdotransferase MoeA [Calidifontibacter sp. DB0510]|uniref:Molybdopterin molybdenumtransferase n=1 Tax=Metallococcus carri TaxID=1656884 RepID=A0A967AYX8_9MICO|nr:molybdopterin molybdotransferase MoeA [Metallococcus carri]NOP38175.1 molybdopterin molybdotransferase MoeA [Calidifontibacter sp. DB2511S]